MLKSPTNNTDSFKKLGIICSIWSEKAGREAAGSTPPNSVRISPPSHLHPPTHLHLHATAGVSYTIAHRSTNIYFLMHS